MSFSSISLSGINSQKAEHYHERISSRRNSKWVIDVKEELEKMDQLNEVEHWEKKCIYKIPACVKDLNKKSYEPQAVSFGPYHHGEDHLNQMEKHKFRALLHFLRRSNKPIESYMDALHRVGNHLIASYDWLDEGNNDYRDQHGNYSDKFLQLMMLDGCFMLEILKTATGTINDYAFNDPIFSYRESLYIMPYIRRDMLMLQNQLPMLLLDTILAVETGGAGSNTTGGGKPKNTEFLNRIIIKFCTQKKSILRLGKCLHVVDVYRKHLLQGPQKKLLQTQLRGIDDHIESSFDVIRPARELYEAGIRFKTSKTTSLRDISFRGGVLRLPVIVVDDTTESTFLNLMAYERFRVGPGNDVTAYIFFMDKIIVSEKDVSLLHSKGIIQNAFGSHKAVAKLFNELSKDVSHMSLDPDSSLDMVHKNVNDYCKKKWNEWRANLIQTYFRSPWAILSVIAALLLMALAFAQTMYTIYPYYHPRSDSTKALPRPPPSILPH